MPKQTVVIINRFGMGSGDPDLGKEILGSFLRKAILIEGLRSILLYNEGVRLLSADCPLLPEFGALLDRGIDIYPCGTCMNKFGIQTSLVRSSCMDVIVSEMSMADKVITI